MQEAIKLSYNGMTLRGMEHVPEGVEEANQCPAVILLHGFTGTKLEPHRMFWKISRTLEKLGIASFRFDFLGSGESDGEFEDMTASKEIAEASAILDFVKNDPRIDANRISLLGMSMGGLVASVLAGDRAKEIDKLVLLAAAGDMYPIIVHMSAGALDDTERMLFDVGGNLVGRAFADDAKGLDVFGRAKAYQGDVLLIHGTQDPTVPIMMSSLYQERCYGSRAKLHLIEGADHTFNKFEWEQDLIEQVCQFLAQ